MNEAHLNTTKHSHNLGRQNWVQAACNALAENGVEKVRVEPLAKELGVTKGSFYWHFKNRQALLDAVLDQWEQQETIAIINKVDSTSEAPSARLMALLEVLFDLSNFKLEKSVRAWTQSDPNVARRMAKMDRQRINHAAAIFVEIGIEPIEAIARARMTMYMWVGAFNVTPHLKKKERVDIARLYHRLIMRTNN